MTGKKRKLSNIKIVDLTQELKVLPGQKPETRASDLKLHDRLVYEKAAKSILKDLNLKDHYTFGHSMRVAYFSLLAGRQLGLNQNDLYDLELAAMFHDIGKIG